jgi:hypothetical protein
MQATSPEPGTLAVDQFPAVCHSPSPAAPVHVSVQLGSATVLAGSTTSARTTAMTAAAAATPKNRPGSPVPASNR